MRSAAVHSLLLALVLPLAALWPLPRVAGRALLAARGQEGPDHLFGLWAAAQSGHPLVVQTPQVNWPEGVDFVLIDPLNLLFYTLPGLLSPALGYNAVLYAGVVVCALGAALLSRELGADPRAGAVLGAFCGPVLASVSEGQTENLAVGWVAVQLALLLRYIHGGAPAAGVGAALALAACLYGGPYNGIFAAALDLPVGLWALRRRPGVLAVGAGALALGAPAVWATLTQRAEGLPGSASRAELRPPAEVAGWRGGLPHGSDLLDAWVPDALTGGVPSLGHSTYLGLGLLGLAAWAVWRERRLWPWLAGAVVFWALSLGPHLVLGGEVLRWQDRALLGPAGVLMDAAPAAARLSRWYRAAAVCGLLLTPLAARALGRRWALAGLVAAELLIFSPMPFPHPTLRTPDLAPLAALPPGPWLEVPGRQDGSPGGALGDDNMLLATLHGQPVSSPFLGLPGWAQGDPDYRALRELARRPMDPAGALQRLAARGFRVLAWYPDHSPLTPRARQALAGVLGEPAVDRPGLILWSLDPVRP